MRWVSAGTFAAAVAALVTGLMALSRAPEEGQAEAIRKEIAQLRGEISTLSTDLALRAGEVKEISARVDALASRPAPAPDPSEVRRQVVRAGGTVPVPMEELPEAVRATAATTLPGAEFARAEERAKDGKSYYRLKGRVEGKEYELRLKPDGSLLRAELPAAAVPEPIRKAAAGAVEGFEIEKASRRLDEEEHPDFFEIEGQAGGDDYDVTVSAAGEILEVQMPTARIPEAVRAAAEKAVPGIALDKEAERKTRDGAPIFELDGRVGRDPYELLISPEGEVKRVRGPKGRQAPPPAPDAPGEPRPAL